MQGSLGLKDGGKPSGQQLARLPKVQVMAKLLLLSIVLPWWSCCCCAGTFLSINCGLEAQPPYNDSATGIQWISDAGLMAAGESLAVDSSQFGAYSHFLGTMRLFKSDNQSKYCYRLSERWVQAGSFFLVRAWFWHGSSPPYFPQSDDTFHFKLLIDADQWVDVVIGYTDTSYSWFEMYTQALRDSIDVCVARTGSNGDAPFISALELCSLPSSLSATSLMASLNRRLKHVRLRVYGVPASSTDLFQDIRYPADSLDRIWQHVDSGEDPVLQDLSAVIDTSKLDPQDLLPVALLQTAYGGEQNTSNFLYFTFMDLQDVSSECHCVLYFAEIDRNVTAAGQRMFDIHYTKSDGGSATPISVDVYAAVGPNVAYEISVGPIGVNPDGMVFVNLSASIGSTFPPFLSAAEFFQESPSSPPSTGTSTRDVNALEDFKLSLSLKSYTGDPCLPVGFAYNWIVCTLEMPPQIVSINLSNYALGGTIPNSLGNISMMKELFLDGNNLVGPIPDLSSMTSLEKLDLSNNKLNGSIPEYLANLENLKVLNLENNNLSGEIPKSLLEKRDASTLEFKFGENPILCGGDTREENLCVAPSSKGSTLVIIIEIVGSILTFLVLVTIVSILVRRKCASSTSNNFYLDQSLIEHNSHLNGIHLQRQVLPTMLSNASIKCFTFQETIDATKNFTTKIGEGGFGPVYKGHLENGDIVAIKVASDFSKQGPREFLNEVEHLSRVHHKNLVKLLGYCIERQLILFYEFMPNGSLFDHLHGNLAKTMHFPWSARIRILMETAQGLEYLHHGCHPRIIHRDIKSSNILLNDFLEAKISDLGISRKIMRDDGSAPSTVLMGSFGYIDPEYIHSNTLTDKVDVYSFGVLCFELICGKQAIFMDQNDHQTNIMDWIIPYINCGRVGDIVDLSLENKYVLSSLWKVIDIALQCVQKPSSKRPTMSDVFVELKDAMHFESSTDLGYLSQTSTIEFDFGYLPQSSQTELDESMLPLTLIETR